MASPEPLNHGKYRNSDALKYCLSNLDIFFKNGTEREPDISGVRFFLRWLRSPLNSWSMPRLIPLYEETSYQFNFKCHGLTHELWSPCSYGCSNEANLRGLWRSFHKGSKALLSGPRKQGQPLLFCWCLEQLREQPLLPLDGSEGWRWRRQFALASSKWAESPYRLSMLSWVYLRDSGSILV